jgi:hypothetical protein
MAMIRGQAFRFRCPQIFATGTSEKSRKSLPESSELAAHK